ncbi:MAG: sensor histidine kinase [Rhodospirillales bacterium]|nr:sensor histidine kinase [Rhodospirillales bacterium]
MNLALGPAFDRIRRHCPNLTVQATAGVLVAAVVLLLVGLDLWNTWTARALRLEVSRVQAQNLADSLAQQVSRSIDLIDVSLREVQDRVAIDGLEPAQVPALNDFLGALARITPQLRDLVVLDQTGEWLAGSIPRPSNIIARERDFFLDHRDQTGRGIAISAPYLSRISERFSIAISRRLEDAQGRFLGVVLAGVDVSYFESLYNGLSLGKRDTIVLFRDDGLVLARKPVVALALGRNVADGPLFRDHVAKAPWGSFTADSMIDGVRRIQTYRRLSELPLVVLIAVAEDGALAGWRRETTAHLGGIGLLTIVVALLAWRIAVLWARQREAERETAKAVADYRLLADNAGDMIVVNDLATLDRRYISPASLAIYGRSPAELIGTNPREFVHPDDWPAVEAIWNGLRSGDKQAMSCHRSLRPDGQWAWVEVKSQVVQDATGRPTGEVVSVVRDVSARIAAERAMRESELRFRAIAENATDIILRIGPDGMRRYVSPAAREILGIAPADMVGGNELRRVHPDDRALVADRFRRMIEGEGPEIGTYSFRALHSDGRTIWLEARDRVLRDEITGRPIELISMLRDMTERVHSEDELRESEGRYRLLAENATDMIIRTSLDGRRLYTSPAYRDILGYSPEELRIGEAGDIICPEDRPAFTEVFSELAAGRRDAVAVEYRVRHRDGHLVWVETRLKLVRDAKTGAPVEVVGVVRDNSRQKANEEKLRAAHAEAERSNRMRSAFFSNMSHELRTPLNAVIGFADLMRQETLGPLGLPKYREYAEDIHTSGEHLLGIINDILDFAKLEAGALVLHQEPVVLGALVATSCRLMAGKAEQKGIDLTFSVADEMPQALGDPVRTKQVLLNLLSNAIKFTPAGGKIRVAAGSAADGSPAISVADTGIGIAAEDLIKVVEPFGQVDNARNREGDGTGLGLPLSRRLMEMQGGALEIASGLGVGTTVTARFLKVEAELVG